MSLINSDFIRVKFLAKTPSRAFIRQFSDNSLNWGSCVYSFDCDNNAYDWLVVYDDLPPLASERFSLRTEVLACPPENTILVTTEPSTIKTYGHAYTKQFGHVLTSQEAWALPHPNRIYQQAGLQWFYGMGSAHERSYQEIRAMSFNKTNTIATVCSSKQQKHTLHNQRYQFTQALKALLPELDIFGHGVKAMDDKAEALDAYRYHLAIENFIGPHHWTEKLADAFLGLTLPFYCGCTNIEDYFPPESFIYIDVFDVEKSFAIISEAIRNNEYEKRLPYIQEARRRVLEEYNLFAVLTGIISEHQHSTEAANSSPLLYSRRLANKKNLFNSLGFLYQKTRTRLLHRFKY